jgi:hypothetical protein
MITALLFALSCLAAVGDDVPPSKPAAPAAAAQAQDPDRPALSTTELKALRDSNIFSPRIVKPRVSRDRSKPSNTPPTPYRQKAPIVTGIFLDAATQAHQAIVEDRNDSSHRYFKEPKFMKVGDEWAGIKLQSVTLDKAIFVKDGVPKDVKVGESLPDSDERPTSAAEPSDDAFADDGETPSATPATTPAPSGTTPPSSKYRKSPPDASAAESKTMNPEAQQKTLDDMKRRLKKKNRPGDNEE